MITIKVSKVQVKQSFHRLWPLSLSSPARPLPQGLESGGEVAEDRLPIQCLATTWCPIEVIQPYYVSSPEGRTYPLLHGHATLDSSDLTEYGLIGPSWGPGTPRHMHTSSASSLSWCFLPSDPDLDNDHSSSLVFFPLSSSAVAGRTTETGAKTSTTTAVPPGPWPVGCPTPAASGTR